MLNQPESLSGPSSTRGRRSHHRTLIGGATAHQALSDRFAADAEARRSVTAPVASPRTRPADRVEEPIIESRPWTPIGETIEQRIARTGALSLVEANTLLAQLVDFSVHQPDDGLVHCPTVRRVRVLPEASGSELQLLGVDGEAPAEGDYESVVFQLGVVLYTALTRRDPFPGETPAHTHLLRATGRYRPATHLNPALPAGVDDFFVRTFSADHLRRFASVFEMRNAFQSIAERASALPPPHEEYLDEYDVVLDSEVESRRPTSLALAADEAPPVSVPLPEPMPCVEESAPASFRLDDAVAAGFAVPAPKRTGRIVFGMAMLTAMSIVAATFIAREVDRPPTREETEQLVETVQTKAVSVGESVKATVEAAR